MARVFLSYDRDDVAKARTLAEALESAGHAVWWDSHIKGGTEYSKEIEQALENAEAVVVLWSRHAIHSPWVRDEAAAGRDRGKLVPVRLDEADPPMGFRQYQNIDLSRWKGRSKPGGLDEVLDCVDRLSGETSEQPAKCASSAKQKASFKRWILPIAVLALAAALLAYFLVNRSGQSSVPVVAVAAADNSPSTRSLADDLFIKLGSLQSIDSEALQLVEQNSDVDPDLRFRVAQRSVDGQAMATVALLKGGNGSLLWSREFRQEQRSIADLQQQIAFAAARVLGCATEAMAPGQDKIETNTLKLYLGGCAGLSVDYEKDPESLVELFAKVTQQAPHLAGAWAKLLMTETYSWLLSGKDAAIGKSLRGHIEQARKVNPTMAEAYVAESWMQQISLINQWMPISEAAVEKNPSNAYALTEHANDMFQVGRLQQGVTFARKAVQADPLSPWVRDSLITALINAGEIEAAKNALKDAERLWPGASNLSLQRFYLLARNGDPREALGLLRSGKVSREYMSPAIESFLEARIDPTPTKVDRAIEAARAVSGRWMIQYVETLAEFGRKEELIEALYNYDPGDNLGPAQVFQPKYGFLHDDIRFMAIMNQWGSQLDYWIKSGKWPDFCSKPGLPYDCKVVAAKLRPSARRVS